MNNSTPDHPLPAADSVGLLFDLGPTEVISPAAAEGNTPRLRRARRDQVVMRCLPLDAIVPWCLTGLVTQLVSRRAGRRLPLWLIAAIGAIAAGPFVSLYVYAANSIAAGAA